MSAARTGAADAADDTVALTLIELEDLSLRVLEHQGLARRHAEAVTRVIVAAQRDECHSHGAYRLLSCVQAMQRGQVARDAEPIVSHRTAAVVAVDAQRGFSPLAFEVGSRHLLDKVRVTGIAALVINHCYHFSALWPEVERLAEQGVVALAITPSHAFVAPAGGVRPVLGTNPMAFAWPRTGGHPYVFDFATSEVARGEIELHRRSGRPIPPGWGVAADGTPTTEAEAVLEGGAMLAFGGHKGSALSTMIELMAGPLIGDLTSLESSAFDAGAGVVPCHGELILAFDPWLLSPNDSGTDQARAERLFAAITGQGARLPSQRRYAARARSLAEGVRIPRALHRDVLALLA